MYLEEAAIDVGDKLGKEGIEVGSSTVDKESIDYRGASSR